MYSPLSPHLYHLPESPGETRLLLSCKGDVFTELVRQVVQKTLLGDGLPRFRS